MQKFNNKIIWFVLILVTLFGLPLVVPQTVHAQGQQATCVFEPLPTGTLVSPGYLNASNTGFKVNVTLAQNYQPYDIALFLDDGIDPIDTRPFVNDPSYTLTSGTSTLAGLKTLLQYNNPEAHSIQIEARNASSGVYQPICDPYSFTADFDFPDGVFSAQKDPSVATQATLKVGDKVLVKFTPSVFTSDISSVTGTIYGRALTWQQVTLPDSSIVYQTVYVIQEGDADQTVSLPLNGVAVQDKAGNLKFYGDISVPINFQIDANSPQLAITSPIIDKTYNLKTVLLNFTATSYDTLKIFLDGNLTGLIAGQNLENLSDGNHLIRIETSDLAGNITIKEVNFSVDTNAPPLTPSISPDGGKIEQGSTIVFEGTSEAGAQITLEIFSEPQVSQTVADAAGKWRFEFDSNKLGLGAHDAYITVADQVGNSFQLKVATFEVVQKPEPVQLALNEQPKQEAQLISQDVTPKVVSRSQIQTKTQEVAKEGKIFSAETARVPTTNWGAWILLLAIVALASALAAAGYYGYEWAGANSSVMKERQEIEGIEKEAEEEAAIIPPEQLEDLSKTEKDQDTPKRQARW